MRLSCDNLQWILVFSSSNICPVLCSIMLIPDTEEGGGLRDTLVAVYKRKFWVILFSANPIVVCCRTMEL